jgi:hypothetical protein
MQQNLVTFRHAATTWVGSSRLWRVECISTAVSNKLQAEVWHGPSQRSGQDVVPLFFLRCLCSEGSSHKFLLFARITMSPPPPRSAAPPCFAPIYNKLTGGGGAVVCLHPSAQPTWPQISTCSVFCLLSFLHHLSSPVRFLGQAHAGHKRWHKNRDLKER